LSARRNAKREEAQMNDRPLISVIIPCYQQAHYLVAAIESVRAQSYTRHEIIVIDDGSTDDTSSVATRYDGLRCIRQRNQGLPAARNTGLRASAGEYVVFLDADDRLLPWALETGVHALRARPECALVYGCCEFIDHAGAALPTPPHPVVAQPEHYRALFDRNYIWTPGAAMFRRTVLMEVGGFDETLIRGCEDLDIYLRIAKDRPLYGHGRIVLQYRKHAGSMSMKLTNMLRAENQLFRKHLKIVTGDDELAELCRRKIIPTHRLLWRRVRLRLGATLRVRTRLRALKLALIKQ
jgi:glycosyltransferase involved in cell wall biosynthesis